MAINKVDLTVSQLVNDLNSGMTWLEKDNLGFSSIETKYGANPDQIATIRKHPALKNAETSLTIFNIIDDTKNDSTNSTTQESKSNRTDKVVEQPKMDLAASSKEVVSTGSSEAADIFANL